MIFGVDYSMSCPCICALHPSGDFSQSKFMFLTSRKRDTTAPSSNVKCEMHKIYSTDQERYDHISNTMINFIALNTNNPTVYIEDYSMGSKGKVYNIGENTGLFKHKVHQYGWPIAKVPPTVIKKFATGKGNADKDAMYRAFLVRGNPDIKHWYYDKPDMKLSSPVSDVVDAYFIALYGANIGVA